MTTLKTTALRPLFLAVLVAAIIGGVTIVWWLLPLGLLMYAASVLLAARDPQTITAAERSTLVVERSVARAQLTSPTFRAVIDEIDRVQGEISRSVEEARGPLQRVLQGIAAQTDELVGQAHELAQKGQVIQRYLATVDTRQIDQQLERVQAQIPQTTDSYTLQQLRETRDALTDRRANAEALQTYGARISAQLQNIAANMSNVLAETIRLRTSDAASADGATNQVADRLRDLNADMDAFQRMLDTALVQSGAGMAS